MTYALRMGAMGMGIEPNIVEIGGSSFGNLTDKLPLRMWRYFGRTDVPSVYVGSITPQRYGDIQGFGKVDSVVFYFGYHMIECIGLSLYALRSNG